MNGGGFNHGTGVGALLVMAVLMLVFWAGLITVVIVVLRRRTPGEHTTGPGPSHDTAERILHERFARGEIDEQEYAARHTALRRTP